MSMRTTEIEVRDPNTNTIPIDVRFDPETEIGELNHYLINQDGNEITITLEMAASLLTAIKRLELSRPQRHSGRWEDNFKTVAEPVQEPVAWIDRYGSVFEFDDHDGTGNLLSPLYAAPVRTKDLTDDEIYPLYPEGPMCDKDMIDFARAVIAADREKNRE